MCWMVLILSRSYLSLSFEEQMMVIFCLVLVFRKLGLASEEPHDMGASLLDSSDDEDAQDVPNHWSHLV